MVPGPRAAGEPDAVAARWSPAEAPKVAAPLLQHGLDFAQKNPAQKHLAPINLGLQNLALKSIQVWLEALTFSGSMLK